MVEIYQDMKHCGIYQALFKRPEGDSCFSIYQISCIKIKKELFVNNRRHFDRVCLCTFQLTVSGITFFLRFCRKFSEEIFFYRPLNSNKPNFVSFLVFFGAAASVTTKISSFETIVKREAIFNPVPKQ